MANQPVNIGIVGAGRMGLAIFDALDGHEHVRLASVWVRSEDAAANFSATADVCISTDLDRVVDIADVIIDFSLQEATQQVAETAARLQKPLVCGVSGLGDEQIAALDAAATVIPLVYDRNMSQGVAVLQDLVQRAAAALGADYHAEIHETHHVHKKDAPSGTALKLGESVAQARGKDTASDIRFESERRGEVPGDHDVIFYSATERLTLSHSVTTRDVFAEGALRAALWVAGREPGRYDMHDVLFGDQDG